MFFRFKRSSREKERQSGLVRSEEKERDMFLFIKKSSITPDLQESNVTIFSGYKIDDFLNL